jgi:hypothetical protein
VPELGGHQQQVVRRQCKLSVLSAPLFLAQCWRRRLLEHSSDWRLEPQRAAAVRRRCALTAIASLTPRPQCADMHSLPHTHAATCDGACPRTHASARCGDIVAAVSATATAGPSATAPTLSPPGGTAARRAQPRCTAHGPHGLAPFAVLRVFAPCRAVLSGMPCSIQE